MKQEVSQNDHKWWKIGDYDHKWWKMVTMIINGDCGGDEEKVLDDDKFLAMQLTSYKCQAVQPHESQQECQ